MSSVTVTPHGENVQDVLVHGRRRVTTLDELCAVAEIDRTVWRAVSQTFKAYETTIKNADGEPVVVPMWSVNATFRRRQMRATFPTIRPITVDRPMNTRRKIQRRRSRRYHDPGVTTALVLPDPHFGFRRDRDGELAPLHDRRALDVALQMAYRLRPHVIVWLGDLLDLPDWSDKFLRTPEYTDLTQPAIVEAHWWLGRFAAASPSSVRHVLIGNHDERLRTQTIAHLRAAYGLRPADELDRPPALSLPRLLALDALGYQWSDDYPDGVFRLTDRFWMIHGDTARSASGSTTAALLGRYDVSVMCGHIHRVEQALATNMSGRVKGAYSPGCLCRIDGIVPGKQRRQNWQQGVGVVAFTDDHEHVELVHIRDGAAVYGGRAIHGADRSDEIREDTATE